jgi:endonuclease/exonuclease/phosphatase family metal-dependent hydrolase
MDWAFGVEFVEHSEGGCEEGNAVLSRFPLGNPVHRFHNVGKVERGDLRAPYDWSLSPDEPRTGRRSFIGADIRFGGGLLHVVAAHLENKSDGAERAGEAGEIVGLIDMLPRRRACVAGDFNVFPDVGVPPVDAPLFDLFEGACYQNPHGDMPQLERRTRPQLGYQIDFTYIRALRVAGRGVLNQIDPLPSDHYPVWVDIEEL